MSSVFVTPLSDPETVTYVFPVTLVDLTVNVPVVAPAATVTVVGVTEVFELFSEIVTDMPPAGAGPERVTVPVAEVPPLKVSGLTSRSVRTGRLTVNVLLSVDPLKVALIVTSVFDATANVVTVTHPTVSPAATVTVAGTDATEELLLVNGIEIPPAGAAMESSTL